MNEAFTNKDFEYADNKQNQDEEMRKLLKPCPTRDQVLDILRSCYVHPSITAVVVEDVVHGTDTNGPSQIVKIQVLSELDSYDDCNYHIKLNDESFLLKIHNGVESADFIECFEKSGHDYFKKGCGGSVLHYQNAMMQVLKTHGVASNYSVSAYRVMATDEYCNGDTQILPISIHALPVISPKHSPCLLAVRLLTWVTGISMSTVKLLPLEAIADAGRFLGRIDKAFDTMTIDQHINSDLSSENNDHNKLSENSDLWSNHMQDSSVLEAGHRFHQWDGKNFSSVRKFVQYITNEKRRNMIETIIDAYDNQILSRVKENHSYFRTGVNHGDFNDANILIDENFRASGVVDFGDSTESWRVLEISVAMAYALLTTYGKANRSISAAAAMLRGYNSIYPLQENEKQHLYLLMICRLACSCTIGAYSLHKNPENSYLLLHSAPAWNALERLWGYDVVYRKKISSAVNSFFNAAYGHSESIDGILNCSDLMLPDPCIPDFLQAVRVKLDESSEDQDVHLRKRKIT